MSKIFLMIRTRPSGTHGPIAGAAQCGRRVPRKPVTEEETRRGLLVFQHHSALGALQGGPLHIAFHSRLIGVMLR